jgi:predicted anti-sigma-YlaC factor YlaD
MNAERCSREDELLDSLGRTFIGPELESHLSGCAPCSELRLVAGAFLDDRAQAMTEAHVPSSGTMWWRMRVRYRQEMEARARRSLYLGQAATLLVAIGLVVSFFGSDVALEVRHLMSTIRLSTPLLLIAATWALAVPIAGWVAIRQK